MNISPSTRLLLHILAVLCLSYRFVLSEDTDLLDAVAANDDPPKASVSTAEPTDSTTDADWTTDMNTTESIVSTSSLPGNLSCVLSNKVCVLEGTKDSCDPCEGVECPMDRSCLADNSTCTSECLCTDETKAPNEEGVCVNPCDAKPCKNNQPCVSAVTEVSKFVCKCSSDYDGLFCETLHDYCKDAPPARCPTGAYECTGGTLGKDKYTCACADGHVLDTKTNSCTKVTQRLTVDLIFSTLYKEAYNVEGEQDRKDALDGIGGAMRDLYGDLLISITYDNFTQGSLVAHYKMDMRMAPNGNPKQNVNDLMVYVTNCEADNAQNKKCFGDKLGSPHLPRDGAVAEDLRCNDVFCPVGTECVPIEKSEKSVRCSCSDGYKLIKTVVEDTGRQIDVCEDIDQCTVDKPCTDGQICVNKPGTFDCVGSPCDKNPCPGNAVCKAVDQYAYDCECEWIYIASDCGTPWPLILVIVSSVLLALLILAIIGLIILFSRSKKGSSVLDSTSL